MRRRARVSRPESTHPPARVLLASGERERDGAGSPSPPPPATRTTTTTSRTFAVDAVDAADAAALVADLVVARADADLADVLATSLTVAIAVEEAGAREAGGVGDGERTAVLCELVLDPTNRWRPSAPDCTATRVVDVDDDDADETADGGARTDVLRVEASLPPPRHPPVRLAAVTLTRTTTHEYVGAQPAASTNANKSPSLPPPPLDVRGVAVVTGEDVDALARAWLARAARCAADALPATVDACGADEVPFPFPAPGFGPGGDALVVAVVDDARLRGCCAATRVYHAEECACALDVFDVASDVASDAAGEEGPFNRDEKLDDAGLINGVPLTTFPPPGAVAAEDRTLAAALHRLCAASDATSDATSDARDTVDNPTESCVQSSAVMNAVSASAARLLSGTRGDHSTSLDAQSSGAASDVGVARRGVRRGVVSVVARRRRARKSTRGLHAVHRLGRATATTATAAITSHSSYSSSHDNNNDKHNNKYNNKCNPGLASRLCFLCRRRRRAPRRRLVRRRRLRETRAAVAGHGRR